jgi:Zn-dependent protease
MLFALLLVSVLLHEFGHCFGARWVNGDATEILIWPLGGLASVDVPNTPRARFLTTAAGPAVNLGLCLACGLLLAFAVHPSYQPPWNPFWYPFRDPGLGSSVPGAIGLYPWGGAGKEPAAVAALLPIVLARLFWVNWMLFWLNVLLVGFPMDGGRMLQAALWNHFGYRQATLTVVFIGFVTMVVVGLFSLATNELLPLCLAGIIYVASKNEWIILETGGEDGLFGYDFSQGYTSLERDQPPETRPRPRRSGWLQRWLQKRTARRVQREQEQREAEERRMDELLEKVQRQGMGALTDEERRFMKRVSDRYRNRN